MYYVIFVNVLGDFSDNTRHFEHLSLELYSRISADLSELCPVEPYPPSPYHPTLIVRNETVLKLPWNANRRNIHAKLYRQLVCYWIVFLDELSSLSSQEMGPQTELQVSLPELERISLHEVITADSWNLPFQPVIKLKKPHSVKRSYLGFFLVILSPLPLPSGIHNEFSLNLTSITENFRVCGR